MSRLLVLWLGWCLAAPALAAEPTLDEDDWVDPRTESLETAERTWEDRLLLKRRRMVRGLAWMGAGMAYAPWVMRSCKRTGWSGCAAHYILIVGPLAIHGGLKLLTNLGGATWNLRQGGLIEQPWPYLAGLTGVSLMVGGWFARVSTRGDPELQRWGTRCAAAGAALAITGFGAQALRNATAWFGSGRRALLPQIQVTPWLEARAADRAGGVALVGTW